MFALGAMMAQMNGSKFVLSNLGGIMAVAENQNDRYIFDRPDSEINWVNSSIYLFFSSNRFNPRTKN